MVNNALGRPKGRQRTRERLLEAAIDAVEGRSVTPVTARAIAREVGVSHSVVNYHFGSFDGLLAQALALRVAPHQIMEAASPDGLPLDLGQLINGFISVWEDPATNPHLERIARRLAGGGEGVSPLIDYLERRVFAPLTVSLGRSRAQQVIIILIGTVFARFVLKVEAGIGPTPKELQRMLLRLTGA